jgi:hypothetical protein
MSGQPNQTPLDASKFRQAYMSNLNLRIELDDKNLQANKTYNRTGQLPVEPSDFRTTEEKLADVLTLRRDVRSQLGKIADGMNANKISVELTPAELVFYYQQSPTINQLIKERYSKGVIADVFIPFLQKYMADTLANKGVASGLQQVSAPNLLLSGENIARALATQPDYLGLLETYMDTGINISRPLTEAINVLPPADLFQRINAVVDANERFTLLEEATNYLKDLPSKNEISAKIREVQRLKNIGDNSGLRGETDRVIQLITPSSDTKIQMENILRALSRPSVEEIPERPTYPFESIEGYEELPGGEEEEDAPPSATPTPSKKLVPKRDAETLVKQIGGIDDFQRQDYTDAELLAMLDLIDNTPGNTAVFGKRGILGIARSEYGRISAREKRRILANLSPQNRYVLENAIIQAGGIVGERDDFMFDPFEGRGVRNTLIMSGRGVVVPTKPRRYDAIKSTDIDTTMGLGKPPRYIPFGRYFINRNRLNDSVVSIKRPSGGSITEFPSQRVSSTLADVLKKIVGRGVPAFEDLEALNEEEKSYLHKLAKESHILDRLSIPAPKKDEVDKDLNRFEILKGQITSGNDNKELIKEFKMLVMKLSNMKIIPKSQARDILFDLTSMGF